MRITNDKNIYVGDTQITKVYAGDDVVYQYGGGVLPDTYQQVEYLQSDGRQRIITNYYMNINTVIEMEVWSASSSQYVPGNQWMQITGARRVYHASNALQVAYNISNHGTAIDYGTGGVTLAVPAETKFKIRVQNQNHMINGTSVYPSGSFRDEGDYPLWVFDMNNAGRSDGAYTGRIYKFTIKENNALIMNLVPCYRKSDNKPGMYDTIGNTFYTNQGNGEFTYG